MNSKRRVLLFLLIVFLSALTPMVAAGQTASQPVGESAALAVDQPEYAQGDVERQTINGTQLYSVSAAPLEIVPQNFDSENVVNFGVATEGGSLQYDEQMRQFEFDASGAGTYELFWVAESTETVQQTVTENRTVETPNGTVTEQVNVTRPVEQTVQTRYTAQIRVRDLATVATVAPDRLDQLETDAQEWRDFNASVVQPLRDRDFVLRPDDRTTAETIEGMAQAYITTGSPFSVLSGNATQILLLMVTTIGGALIAAIFWGWSTFSVSQLRGKLNRFESAESEEGELADRKADLALQERTSSAAGTDLVDLPEIDDYWGQLLGDAHGQDLATAWESVLGEHWGGILTDWLTVMTQNGYQVVGEGDAVEVLDADAETDKPAREVSNLSADELGAINADEPPVSTFDLEGVDIDWSALGEDTVVLDLEQWADHWGLGIDHEADVRNYGNKLVALCEAVENAEFTDQDGSVRPERAYLNAYQRLTDGADHYDLPGAPMLRELLQAALRHRSPSEKTDQTIQDIQDGRYSPGGD